MSDCVEPKLFRIRCPYCGFEWWVKFGDGSRIVTCPSDEGGCNRKFAIEVNHKPIVTIFKLEVVAMLTMQD